MLETRRPRVAATATLTVALALASAGCGDSGTESDEAPASAETTIEREGSLAGTLHVTPATARPGETVRIAVENRGDAPLAYGLGADVQRFDDGGWEEVSSGIGPAAVPDIGLVVEPGERRGPGEGAIEDRLELSEELEPGVYRVLKDVSDPGGQELTLEATFEVTPAG